MFLFLSDSFLLIFVAVAAVAADGAVVVVVVVVTIHYRLRYNLCRILFDIFSHKRISK